MDTKTEEVIDALNTIALGYGRKTDDVQAQATRNALRVLAGHVVDALYNRKGSQVQSTSLEALQRLASTARGYRVADEAKRENEKGFLFSSTPD